MALAGVTRATLRTRLFATYNEVEGGGGEFTLTAVGTVVQQAVHEFCLRTGFYIGSASRARPDNASGEALLTLPTGMIRLSDVEYHRQISSTVQRARLRETTPQHLALREGAGWARHTDTNAGGTSLKYHAWYRRGNKRIGFYPPNITTTTAGTIIVQGPMIPDLMANSTSVCVVPEQFIMGAIYIGCRMLSEIDADSDAEGARAAAFEAKAGPFIQAAQGYRPSTGGD